MVARYWARIFKLKGTRECAGLGWPMARISHLGSKLTHAANGLEVNFDPDSGPTKLFGLVRDPAPQTEVLFKWRLSRALALPLTLNLAAPELRANSCS